LVGVVLSLLRTGAELGLKREDLMADAGLGEADIADRDLYLPVARQVALGEAIVRRLPGVNVGMEVLQRFSPASFGILGYVITHAASLEDALAGFIRFQRLLTDGIRWRVTAGKAVSITVEAEPALTRLGHPIEAVVGLWVMFGRQLTGTRWLPLDVRFRHAPLADPAEVERFFGTRVRFGAPSNELRFDPKILEAPIVAGSPALFASAVRLAEARLMSIEGHGTSTNALRELMFEQLPRGVTLKADFARRMGMSVRTLDRRLLDEQTGFGDVLDRVRQELALSWLGDRQYAAYEVAYLLGYSDPTTFQRSFRRWTGSSPSEWRRAREG
jgi:AraC-like DNA-binding protein